MTDHADTPPSGIDAQLLHLTTALRLVAVELRPTLEEVAVVPDPARRAALIEALAAVGTHVGLAAQATARVVDALEPPVEPATTETDDDDKEPA